MELGHTTNIPLFHTAGSRTARSWSSDELSMAYWNECTPLKIVKGLVFAFVQQVLVLIWGAARSCNSQKRPHIGLKLEAFIEFQNFSLFLATKKLGKIRPFLSRSSQNYFNFSLMLRAA